MPRTGPASMCTMTIAVESQAAAPYASGASVGKRKAWALTHAILGASRIKLAGDMTLWGIVDRGIERAGAETECCSDHLLSRPPLNLGQSTPWSFPSRIDTV